MEFDNNKSIFLQIADNIAEKIINGTYPSGEKIPSVREQAAEMGVNPNTIMRTYSELQVSGIIENKRGIGYFVTEQAKKVILQKKRNEFFHHVLPEFIRQAELLDIPLEEIKKHLNQLNYENK